jgi:5,10-methylenetetrahydrofolate reductase
MYHTMNARSHKVEVLCSALIIKNFKFTGKFKESCMGPYESFGKDVMLMDDMHAKYKLIEISVIHVWENLEQQAWSKTI